MVAMEDDYRTIEYAGFPPALERLAELLIKALDLLEVQRVPVRTRLYGVRRQRFLIRVPGPRRRDVAASQLAS